MAGGEPEGNDFQASPPTSPQPTPLPSSALTGDGMAELAPSSLVTGVLQIHMVFGLFELIKTEIRGGEKGKGILIVIGVTHQAMRTAVYY